MLAGDEAAVRVGFEVVGVGGGCSRVGSGGLYNLPILLIPLNNVQG